MVRVDDNNYVWMGNPDVKSPLVKQVGFEYTSTQSIFTMQVESKIGMNITFLSPVEPEDLLRASLPYSYLEVSVYSIDSQQHNVSIYTDVSAGMHWCQNNNQLLTTCRMGVRRQDCNSTVGLWHSQQCH